MTLVLSLQGAMAVGKTTALAYLQEQLPELHISYEDNTKIIQEISKCGLDKNNYCDYLEIQKLFLSHEIQRWKNCQQYETAIMDMGAEEIEFYTLNFPKSAHQNWDIETPLHVELNELQICMPNRILFLEAEPETLIRRKQQDTTRSRTFFDYQLTHLVPLKHQWFLAKSNVDVLKVDSLSAAQVGQHVVDWVKYCQKQQ